ncbi:hypothetical protein ACFX13_011374 [Malus domestica]
MRSWEEAGYAVEFELGAGWVFLGQDNRFRDEVVEANNTNNTNTSNVSASINERDSVYMSSLFPAFRHLQNHSSLRPTPRPPQPPYQVHPTPTFHNDYSALRNLFTKKH